MTSNTITELIELARAMSLKESSRAASHEADDIAGPDAVDDLQRLSGQELQEKWSERYKRSINCSHPRGFSQRAHCAGKKKHNESQEQCPECGGDMYPDTLINEKQDACYYKVKSRYRVWPSAYASGALVKCRKKGAKNWGNKNESLEEDLDKWFKERWVRFGPDGKIRGDCARGSAREGKPKCLPLKKAQALGKKGRASAAGKKRREDPDENRQGPAINVRTKVDEITGDDAFDRMLKDIKAATGPQAKIDKTKDKEQRSKEISSAFDNMFGGGNPADKLSIKKLKEQSIDDLDELQMFIQSAYKARYGHKPHWTEEEWQDEEFLDKWLHRLTEEEKQDELTEITRLINYKSR